MRSALYNINFTTWFTVEPQMNRTVSRVDIVVQWKFHLFKVLVAFMASLTDHV